MLGEHRHPQLERGLEWKLGQGLERVRMDLPRIGGHERDFNALLAASHGQCVVRVRQGLEQ